MGSEVNEILETLKYGSRDDKLEAMMLARRRANVLLLDRTAGILVKKISVAEAFSLAELEDVKSGLREVLARRKDTMVCWYAIITLVDLGEESDKLLKDLLSTITQVMSWLIRVAEGGGVAPNLVAARLELEVKEETLRALSRFKHSAAAGEIIKEYFEDELLLRNSALYAFGALANPEYRGLVEYQATRAKEGKEREAAIAALALWGQADYDNIVKYAEEKEKPQKKGFLKRFFG